MEQNIFDNIIAAAVQAPSGDNCQPWRFDISGNTITIYNLPERDTSLYSFGQRPSYIAHGAAIENMCIAATTFGYDTSVQYDLVPSEQRVARITCSKNPAITADSLSEYISKRHTNRKPYLKQALSEIQQQAVIHAAQSCDGDGTIQLVTEKKQLQTLGSIASTNEQILFENKEMHTFFFDHVTWTEQEDREKSIGFYVKTLEVPTPAIPMFSFMKTWSHAQMLGKIGISKFIAAGNSKIYESSAAIGALIVPTNTAEQYITAGRMLQRVWLTTASLGLHFQPLTGIPLLYQRVVAGDNGSLSEKHISLVTSGYKGIQDVFGLQGQTVVLLFRVGNGKSASARSGRLQPHITYNT